MQFQLKHLGLVVGVLALAIVLRDTGSGYGQDLTSFSAAFIPIMVLSCGVAAMGPPVRTEHEIRSALWLAIICGTVFAFLLALFDSLYRWNHVPKSLDRTTASVEFQMVVLGAAISTGAGFAAAVVGASIGLVWQGIRSQKKRA